MQGAGCRVQRAACNDNIIVSSSNMSHRLLSHPSFDRARATRTLAEADPQLGALIARVGPFALETERLQSPFAALAESIVYQQLTGKAAATIHGRVVALFRPRRSFGPEDILSTPEGQLRGCGLSRAKTAALKDLAVKTLEGVVPPIRDLRRLDDEAIIDRLVSVRGIGRWTVEMLLIFRLGRADVLPVTDYGVQKGFARTFRRRLPTPKELARRGERWKPFRSVAAWYLWRAVDGALPIAD